MKKLKKQGCKILLGIVRLTFLIILIVIPFLNATIGQIISVVIIDLIVSRCVLELCLIYERKDPTPHVTVEEKEQWNSIAFHTSCKEEAQEKPTGDQALPKETYGSVGDTYCKYVFARLVTKIDGAEVILYPIWVDINTTCGDFVRKDVPNMTKDDYNDIYPEMRDQAIIALVKELLACPQISDDISNAMTHRRKSKPSKDFAVAVLLAWMRIQRCLPTTYEHIVKTKGYTLKTEE